MKPSPGPSENCWKYTLKMITEIIILPNNNALFPSLLSPTGPRLPLWKNGSGQREIEKEGKNGQADSYTNAPCIFKYSSIPVSELVNRMGKRLADTLSTF